MNIVVSPLLLLRSARVWLAISDTRYSPAGSVVLPTLNSKGTSALNLRVWCCCARLAAANKRTTTISDTRAVLLFIHPPSLLCPGLGEKLLVVAAMQRPVKLSPMALFGLFAFVDCS